MNIRNGGSLGSGAVTVVSGNTLQLQGGISVANAITLSGQGVSSLGGIRSISGVNTLSGVITLGALSRINTDGDELIITGNIVGGANALYVGSNASSGVVSTTINGVISGAGGSLTWGTAPSTITTNTSLIKENAYLTLQLGGANSYLGTSVLSGGVLRLGASDVLANASNMIFNGGSLNTNGYTESLGTISVTSDNGSLVLGSGVHSLSFSGVGTIDYKTLKVIGWQGDYSSTTGVSGTAGKFIINNALTTEFINKFKLVLSSYDIYYVLIINLLKKD
jgi:hypothetical protein